MKEKNYIIQNDPSKLQSEIKEIYEDVGVYGLNDNTECKVFFPESKDPSDWIVIDGIVSNHEAVSLQDVKNQKNSQIDSRTQELIRAGNEYANEIFSLSDHAQRNWIGIAEAFTANVLSSLFSSPPTSWPEFNSIMSTVHGSLFPMAVSTLDDKEFSFDDFPTFMLFYNGAFAEIKVHYMSGRALKLSVNNAVSISEVEEVEDNR